MKNLAKYPTISVVFALLNTDLATWKRTLEALKMQDYPKNKIEYLVMDGGSTNGAVQLARIYGCKVFVLAHLRNNAGGRIGLGITKARGKIILLLESDNILVGDQWLKQMVQPFLESKLIVSTFSIHNTYEKDMSILTKYCALLGTNDPLVYYLGKSEKLLSYEEKYNKGEVICETKHYYITRFTKQNLPTLGTNGHMVLRKVLLKAVIDPYKYLHTDAFALILSLGFDHYGVVKNSIIHVSGDSIINLILRRAAYKRWHYDRNRNTRYYLVYNPASLRDNLNVVRFVISSLLIFPTCIESIWWYLHKRDPAWFLHPIVCYLITLGYSLSEVRYYWGNFLKRRINN
jgi:hypothetical protein